MNEAEPIEDERGNKIWPGAWVTPGAVLGRDNVVMPNAFIGPRAVVGDRNWFQPFSVLGSASQAREKDRLGRIEIGDGCEFHPFSTVNESSDALTVTHIGNDVIVMQAGHVGHDCTVGDRVVLSNQIALAGHVVVDDDAIIGAHALVAQHLRIGARAHVLPQMAVRRNVWAFETFDGKSARPLKINARAVRRLGGRYRDLSALRAWYAGNDIADAIRDTLIDEVRAVISAGNANCAELGEFRARYDQVGC